MTEVPERARVVVVGGGVVGCSVAYHLTGLGWTDVVVLEQGRLSSGTTWHAAGLVGPLRATESGTRLVQYSAELYARLEEETGLATGYRNTGGLVLARTPDRMTQLRRTAANATAYDLPCEVVGPDRARGLWPPMQVDDVLGGAAAARGREGEPDRPHPGLAQGARQRGARVVEKTRVTGSTLVEGRVSGVVTDRGRVECEVVVNCAGPVGQGPRRPGGRHRPPALGRALLRRDRGRRGHPSRPADHARPRRVDLLQGGGRRPRRGRLRARRQALALALGPAAPLRVPAPRGGLGALLGPHGPGRVARPGARRDGDPQVLQRAGVLHA